MYEDIVNLEYPNEEIENFFSDEVLRAAQFAPFSALTGYEDVISETARTVDTMTVLDESAKEEIDRKLVFLNNNKISSLVFVTYFVADKFKDGGTYITKAGRIKRISQEEKKIIFEDKCEILIETILKISSPVFSELDLAEP